MDGVLLAHETGEGSLSDALVGQMYLINSSVPPPYQESATLAGAITYKQTEPPVQIPGIHLPLFEKPVYLPHTDHQSLANSTSG